MFKNISTIILTVLCLLSCSEAKDDIPSQNPDVPPTPDANMISFSSSDSNWQEGETNTRATEQRSPQEKISPVPYSSIRSTSITL